MTTLGLRDLGFLGGLGGGAAYDTDAQTYITAVEAADGQALETAVKDAINALASERATVGANQSALNMYQEQLGTLKDNLAAANSRIKDIDVAEESTNFAKYNILVQAGTAMLSQANSTSQSVLRLLN